jgi:hypothetical protein
LIKIENDYGYCTVKIIDGKIETTTKIPLKPNIRIITENTNELQYQEAKKILENKYHVCGIVRESTFKTKPHSQHSLHSPHSSHSSTGIDAIAKNKYTAYGTQKDIILDYLKKKNLTNEEIQNIITLHEKIYQLVLSEKKDQVADIMHNATKNQQWKILELRFTNALSYGKDNIIDFRKYEPNRIIGIMAPNHYGKSAVLDIILFCLFDKFSRGERRDILNKNENRMQCSLLFSIGSQIYLIERIGQRSKNGLTVKIDVNFFLIRTTDRGKEFKENLNGLDKNDTNKKIIDLIGDYNDYLTTCFSLQHGKCCNFTEMTQLQKKEYLNDILKLNVFEDCYNIAKDRLKDITSHLKVLEQKVGFRSIDEIKKSINDVNTELRVLETNEKLNNELKEYVTIMLSNCIEPKLTVYHELRNY